MNSERVGRDWRRAGREHRRRERWKGTEFLHPRPLTILKPMELQRKAVKPRRKASRHCPWNRRICLQGPPQSRLHQPRWQRLPRGQLLLRGALIHPGLLKEEGSCSGGWSGGRGISHSSQSRVGGDLAPSPYTYHLIEGRLFSPLTQIKHFPWDLLWLHPGGLIQSSGLQSKPKANSSLSTPILTDYIQLR